MKNDSEYRRVPNVGVIAYEQKVKDWQSEREAAARQEVRELQKLLADTEFERDRFKRENARVMEVVGQVGSLRETEGKVELSVVVGRQEHVSRLRIGTEVWLQTGTNERSGVQDVGPVVTLSKMLASKEDELQRCLKDRDDARNELTIAKTDLERARAELVQGVLETERLKLELAKVAPPDNPARAQGGVLFSEEEDKQHDS
jgi:hypothetical protein